MINSELLQQGKKMKILIKYLVIINLLITINSFGQVINVDDFGAKGNGVTDDRVAIQSALNQLRSNGGELQFTSGKVYIIGSGLVFNNAPSSRNYLITSTETEKATIKIKDGTPVTYGNWGLFMSDSRNVTISNLRLDGNRDNRVPAEVAGTYLFQIMNNCNGLRLYDVILENSVIDNLMITATNDVINDTTRYLSDFEMYNCVLKNGWRNNMSIIRGMNFKIIGCEFDNAHGLGDPEAGIDFEPNGETSVLGYHNILIEGCIFRNNGRTGITLIDHDEIDIEGGVTIKNNLFDNNGIMMMGQDNVIKNNVFINYDHAPVISYNGLEGDGIVYIYSDEATANNKVYENYFYDNPMPADKNLHLIHFGSRIQESNSAYNNYEYNNTIAGFVKVSTSVHQDVHDNVEINRKEIGYWSMDASTINGNSLADSSYFVQNGTLYNSPAIVNGQYNEALDFSPDNKYVEIPITDNLNIEVNMTISAWVNWKGANSETEQVIVGKDGDWEFSVDNTGKLGFYSPQSNMASYNGGWIKTTESIIQDEWTYVAFTYNGMESKIYMNGVETASELCRGNLSTNSTKIYIGSLVGETSSFNGIVDDVKMYNYPLSSSEIDSLSKLVSGHNKTKPLGAGTASSPYQISSIVNLSWLAQSSDKWSAHYIQVADIDLSITATWDDSDDNNDGDKYNDANDKTSAGSNDGWYPIGNSTKSFTGTYNGQGFLLSNLTIKNREKSIGLFGKVTGGELKNIALNKLYMEGNAEVGGLAGVIEDHCTISNSYTNGEIKCIDGGNVGKGFGGLIGKLSSSTINRCYSQVDIEGAGNNNQTIGGLVGMVNSLSNIIESYSLGNIELAGNSSGGFVGMLDNSTVSNSYSFGALSISNSSLMGYGGFIGSVQGGSNISYCYSIGLVDTHLSGKGFVGEIASGSPNFTSNVFDKNLSGQESSVGGVGKTSEDMMTESTFSNMGWNFVSIWKTNGSYPNLRENSNKDLEYGGTPGEVPGIKGNGTEEDPYQIARLSDLSWLSQNNSVWELNFIQMVDIDASQTATWDDSDDNNDGNKYNDPNDLTTEGTNDGFLPIGNKTLGFTGNYNGNNYSISNLTITRPNGKYVGLFGQIKVKNDMMSTIENLLLTKMKIIGDGYVGGLVGKNFLGQIKNCSTEGEIGSCQVSQGCLEKLA